MLFAALFIMAVGALWVWVCWIVEGGRPTGGEFSSFLRAASLGFMAIGAGLILAIWG